MLSSNTAGSGPDLRKVDPKVCGEFECIVTPAPLILVMGRKSHTPKGHHSAIRVVRCFHGMKLNSVPRLSFLYNLQL